MHHRRPERRFERGRTAHGGVPAGRHKKRYGGVQGGVLRKERRFAGAGAVALVLTAAALAFAAPSGASPNAGATSAATSTSTTTTTAVPGTGDAPSTTLPTEPAPPGYPVPKAPPKGAPPAPPLSWLTAAQTTGGPVIGQHGTIEQLAVNQAAVKRSEKAVKVAEQRLTDIRTH